MPNIPVATLDALRKERPITHVYASVHRPLTLWTAQINDPAITKGTTDIVFSSGSGVDFSAIGEYQEVWIGTEAEDHTYGKFRIRGISSGDGGVTGTLTIPRHSKFLQDGLWLTFKLDYPLTAKLSYFTHDGDIEQAYLLKDGDIAYTDQNDKLGPVLIAGGHRGGFIEDGVWTVSPPLAQSYPMTPGSTITNYSASVYPSTGAAITIDNVTGACSIDFTTPGQYWVTYSITDSTGAVQKGFRFYYAHSTSLASEHFPLHKFTLGSINMDFDTGAYTTDMSFKEYVPEATIPERALAILWHETTFETSGELDMGDDKIIFAGYILKSRTEQKLETDIGTVSFSLASVTELMKQIPLVPVDLTGRPSPTKWTEFRSDYLTIGSAIKHIWQYHSTLMEIADVYDLDQADEFRAYTQFESADNLFSVADTFSYTNGDRRKVVATKQGEVRLTEETQLMVDADRSAVTTVAAITNEDLADSLTLVLEEGNSVSQVKVNGFVFDNTFYNPGEACKQGDAGDPLCDCNDPPCPDVEVVCAASPGEVPDDDGARIEEFFDQAFVSQTQANKVAGRYFAKLNNPVKEVRVVFHSMYLPYLEPALSEQWTISILPSENRRGVSWVNKPLYLKGVEASYKHEEGFFRCTAIFEPEAIGADGVAEGCDDPATTSVSSGPPATGLEAESGVWVASSGRVHFGESGLYEWSIVNSRSDIEDLVLDLWNKGATAATTGLIRCGLGFIETSSDGGQTWTDITPDSSLVGGYTPTLVTFKALSVNYRSQGYACVAQYDDAGWKSWILYSTDGSTWQSSEILSVSGAKALSVEVDKGDGTDVWVSAWDGSNLRALYYDVATLTQQGNIDLGGCTSLELDVTYSAYVVTTFSKELFVFGRFNHPTLGVSQVIYSSDWLAFSQVVSTWSTDHCEALWSWSSTSISAIRAGVKLYKGDLSGLSLVSSVTDISSVRPHGAVEKNGIVYLGDSVADTILLSLASPPYSVWDDVTFTLNTDLPIVSLVLY